jgi:hypothetical protein
MDGKVKCANLGCKNHFKGFCSITLKCGLNISYEDEQDTTYFTEDQIDQMKLDTLKRHNVT